MNSSHFSCSSFTRVCSLGLALGGLVLVSHPVAAGVPGKFRQVSARSLVQGYAVDPVANDTLRPADRTFLTKASETVRQQLRLGEVGVGQAGDSRVRSHAKQLVSDYRSLNDALDALIRRKGGIAGAAVGGTSENYQKLGQKAGLNFDREFVLAAGHATDAALALFEQIVSETKDTDTRELAAAQLPILRAHRSAITELRRTFE